MSRIRIKNWSRHQHFKDRTPPWIKLYRELLNDPDWHDLDGDTSKVLIGLWLIASEDETHQGLLPDVRKLAFRLRISERSLNQALTKLSAWVIQDDIAVISGRYQVDALETEERPRATKSRRATHLPAEWMPSDSDIAFCRQERPELDPSRVAERFRDYWVAKGGADGRKTDWAATWRNTGRAGVCVAEKSYWEKLQSPAWQKKRLKKH